jgi:transposase InsO family protein
VAPTRVVPGLDPFEDGSGELAPVFPSRPRKTLGWRTPAEALNDIIYRWFNRPVLQRRIEPSQYTSWAFTENVRRLGLISSIGTVGDCYDNAPMESFWGSMQIELLNRQSWRTNLQLGVGMADYIENFYNTARRHSALNYLTPIEFEDLHLTHIHQAALS